MKCPFCDNKTRIYNSRSTQGKTQTWRRHRCLVCKRAFTTRERIDWNGIVLVADKTAETTPYNHERLLLSLVRAIEKLEAGTTTPVDICDTIELRLQQKGLFNKSPLSSVQIAAEALTVLHLYDPNAALQYLSNLYQGKPPAELLKRYVTS